MNNRNLIRLLVPGALIVALIILLAIERLWVNEFLMAVVFSNPLALILFIVAAALGALAAWEWDSRGTLIASVPAGLVALAWVAVLLLGGYDSQKVYMAQARPTDDPIGNYEVRAPYEVAQALAPNAVRTNGDLNPADTTYLPQTATYTSVVNGRTLPSTYTELNPPPG